MELPKHYESKSSEAKWIEFWNKEQIYKFTPSKKPTFAVDTPPPTVSGKMHIGHAFSYTQGDILVRYARMRGNNVFYPFGTDDNGLPTEKLVEKMKNIRATKMEREQFIKICQEVISQIRPDFIQDWKRIGMSCDFSTPYSTISDYAIKTAQKSFLDLYKKGLIYQKTSPTIWDTRFQSAVAQAELEDLEQDSLFNTVIFKTSEGEDFEIGTTRPELIPACVAVFIHPEDEKNARLIGKKAIVPLTNQEVPILADESVNREKGSGILMISSYGDRFDVDAIQRKNLTPNPIVTKEGKLNEAAGPLEGLSILDARKKALEILKEQNLLKDQKKIRNTVNVYEKSQIPIEFVATKQWFVKIIENKDLFLASGEKLKWHPESMKKRYENWVKNLNWDWCISRQRPFGVPFPVWYDGSGNVVLAEESELPVFPATHLPKGKETQNLTPELDVMDTWATSSLTPELAGNWIKESSGYEVDFNEVSPFALRLQAHDIIRTWAFYTLIKSEYHHKALPWSAIAISGNVADPKGEKMSKSKGNVVDPFEVMEKYSGDALRYWAAGSKLGEDLSYNEKDLLTGQKTVTKLWNATRFALLLLDDFKPAKEVEFRLVDRWLLTRLHNLAKETTEQFDSHQYARVKLAVDSFFWQDFTGNYLELVKDRLYNPQSYEGEVQGAKQALYTALYAISRFFAPFMPFITEEIYQMYFKEFEKEKSIHLTSWPSYDEFLLDDHALNVGQVLMDATQEIRKAKAEKKVSMKEPVKQLFLSAEITDEDLELIRRELQAGLNVEEIIFTPGEFGVDVKL